MIRRLGTLTHWTSFRRVGGKQDRSTNMNPCTLINAVLDYAFNVGLRTPNTPKSCIDKAQIKNTNTLSTILQPLQKLNII